MNEGNSSSNQFRVQLTTLENDDRGNVLATDPETRMNTGSF